MIKLNKYILAFVSFGLLMLLTRCSSFLDEDPKDQVFVENFFETENDGISAVNAIYAILNSTSTPPTYGGVYHSSYWVATGLASDEMENRFVGVLEYDQLDNFQHNGVNGTLYDIWQNAYKGISKANFALHGIPSITMDESRKLNLMGEAYFLRALLYFDLVRLFGEIPLLTEIESDLFPSKASITTIYDQIRTDLSYAKEHLTEDYAVNNGLGRATWGAATALLAKVELTQGNYQSCIDLCDEIIASNNYELYEDYADAFRIENENGKETIFSIGFGDANGAISFWEVGQFNVRLLPQELREQIPGVNAQGWQVATQNLFNSFDPKDRRRTVTLMTEVNALDGRVIDIEPHIRKYWDESSEPSAGNTANDFRYLRYADVFLMKAEAINERDQGPNTEAYNAVNLIRARARFDGNETLDILPDLENLSYEQFKIALLNERRWEFTGEGHRWFDLVRLGYLVDAVQEAKPNAQVASFHSLFPLPQEELDLNENLLPQNSGY